MDASPQLGGFSWESCNKYSRHPGETLGPLRDVLDEQFAPQPAGRELGVEHDQRLVVFLPRVGQQVGQQVGHLDEFEF